jgi:outer membrane protein assembly factor BamB
MNDYWYRSWSRILLVGLMLLEGGLLALPTSASLADAPQRHVAPAETGLPDLIFRDGFESGNFSAWSSTQPGNGDLSVTTAAALVGMRGMQVRINDNAAVFVTDDTPSAEGRYRARFYFDPNAIAMANGDSHYLLMGYEGTTAPIVGIELGYQGGYRVRGSVRDDPSVGVITNWVSISDAAHFIELDWRAATAPGANNGGMTLWVDGMQQADLVNIDNDTWQLDRVQMGAVYGVDNGTRGAIYFDAFESRRVSYIGPETGISPSATPIPTRTNTALPSPATPTQTRTATRTNTALPQTATSTPTCTSEPPSTPTPTRTSTPTPTSTVWHTPTSSPTPPTPPGPSSEWAQDAHDAQRSSFSPVEFSGNWTLLWTWNGPDANGGAGGHFYNAPREARTVTGGDYIYAPAGSHGIYALHKADGSIGWRLTAASFNAAPAYDLDSGYLYAGGADGNLYKIDTATGAVAAIYLAGGPLDKAVLLAGGYVYVITEGGVLHKVDAATMTPAWTYTAGSGVATSATYSALRNVIVFASDDLYVHAVNISDGTLRWRVKPTIHDPSATYTFEGYWPVIAERHGIVFVRMNLGMAALWSGPGPSGMYPSTNADTRAFLVANPQWKNLFALSLDNGAEAFIPAVGFGGVEALRDGSPVLEVGPVPVVRLLPDGSEVAYMPFRSGQGDPPDGRWDSHIGEMVLDDTTISGLVAGDLRFVDFPNSYTHITDEQTPLTMAGNMLFNAHWGASESILITDRSPTKGLSHEAPITAQARPAVVRRMQTCSIFNPTTHWTTCGLTLYGDGRYWNGPGFWTYWNVLDPPTPPRPAYSEGILPRYTYVSGGLVVVEGNGGELLVFSHP